jgi:fibronectin-binding autotransporter adhesin
MICLNIEPSQRESAYMRRRYPIVTLLALLSLAPISHGQQPFQIKRVVTTGNSGAGENTAPGISVSPTIEANFTSFGVAPVNFGRTPQIDAGGNVTFSSYLNGVSATGVGTLNDTSSWFFDGTSLSLVAREGSAAPGTSTNYADDGGTTRIMSNSSGHLLFAHSLQDGTWGVFADQGNGLGLLAKEGAAAPGTSANFTHLRVGMQLNESGTALIHGSTTAGIGLWTQEAGGSLRKIQSNGDVATGLGGAVFSNTSTNRQLGFNDTGDAVFASGLAGAGITTSNDTSIWQYDSSTQSVSLLLREGDSVGAATVNQLSEAGVNVAQFNDQNQLAFLGSVHQSGQNRQAVLSNRSGAWDVLYRSGDAIASVGGAQIGTMGSLKQNQLGNVQFVASLTGSGITTENDLAILTERAGAISMTVREGDTAAGTAGGIFGQISSTAAFSDVVFNSQGQSAFVGTLKSGAGDTIFNNNDQGIWATDPFGTLQLVARRGTTALPFTNDLLASNNVPWPFRDLVVNGLNDQGQLLFTAFSTGNATAAFVTDLGSANVAAGQMVILDQTGDVNVPGEVNVEGEVVIEKGVKVKAAEAKVSKGGKVSVKGTLESNIVSVSGELKVNGDVTGDVTVEDGGVLSGNAQIDGELVIADGGTLAPGNSPGIILNNGDVTFEGGGIFEFQLLDAAIDPQINAPSTGWTLLEIDGDLLLDSAGSNPFIVSIEGLATIGPDVSGTPSNFDGSLEHEFVFVTWTGQAWSFLDQNRFQLNVANGADFGPGGFSLALADGGQGLKLVYAVPEVPSWGLLLTASVAAGCLSWRRKT